MKKNDPNNLRIPAVNLLTEIVPEGSKVGVWTFGQYVNNLVKHDTVDAQWRKDAKNKAKQINSVALFTNIGGVLEKSSDDFYKDIQFKNTHFILLTDGMVDIDRDPSKNESERKRILSDIVKKFKDKGARIHTVALSENADQSLLDKLAIETEGYSEVVASPEELTKIFLKTFDQAVPAEQVPLEGNTFNIDSSIEEFTALIFRKENSDQTVIKGPDDKAYTHGDADEYLKWYRDKGYDLITVRQPVEGEWKIDAELLPDSRVTVVSNLQMDVTKLPPYFYAGDVLNVDVSFLEDGKRLTNPDLLSLLDIKLNLKTEDNKSGTKTISDPANPPADGFFRDSISKLKKEGQYEVNVLVDGKTFQRKSRQLISLRTPIDVELAATGSGDQTAYQLVITPRNKKIDFSQTSVATKMKAPDASTTFKNVPFNEANGVWEMPIEPLKGDGTYQVALRVKGKTEDGNEFSFSPPIFDAVFPREVGDGSQYVPIKEPEDPENPVVQELPEDPVVEPEVEEPAPAIDPPIAIPEVLEQEQLVETMPSTPEEEGLSDLVKWSIVGGASLLTVLLSVGAFLWIRKKRNTDDVVDDMKDVEEQFEDTFDEPEEETLAIEDELDFVEEPEPVMPDEPMAETVVDEVEELVEPTEIADIDSVEEEPLDIDDFMSEDLIDETEDTPPVLESEDILEETEEVVEEAMSFEEQDDIPVVEEETDDVNIDDLIEDVVDGKTADEVVDEILANNDDIDEEFNLEDFDIADTSDIDLVDEEEKKKKDE